MQLFTAKLKEGVWWGFLFLGAYAAWTQGWLAPLFPPPHQQPPRSPHPRAAGAAGAAAGAPSTAPGSAPRGLGGSGLGPRPPGELEDDLQHAPAEEDEVRCSLILMDSRARAARVDIIIWAVEVAAWRPAVR